MPTLVVRWTNKEIQFLIDELRKGDLPPRGIAKRLGCSKRTLYNKMRELGLHYTRQARVWTPERCALLIKMWERGDSINEISCALAINANTMVRKAYELNLRSRPATPAKVIEVQPVAIAKWPDLPPDAFKDVKVGRDVQFRQNRPQDRTLGGVGQTW